MHMHAPLFTYMHLPSAAAALNPCFLLYLYTFVFILHPVVHAEGLMINETNIIMYTPHDITPIIYNDSGTTVMTTLYQEETTTTAYQTTTTMIYYGVPYVYGKDSSNSTHTLKANATSVMSDGISKRHVASKQYNLTMCAMIRDEMPYILEWIEHHRRQGVNHFYLYDDGSVDDSLLVPQLYKDLGFGNLVEVLPINQYRHNRLPPHKGTHHDDKQMYALSHCNGRSTGRSDWIIVTDVDEFMYAPTKHETVWQFMDSMQTQIPSILQFSVVSVRYGTSGLVRDFRGYIDFDAYASRADVLTDGGLIVQANPNRAPHDLLDQDYWDRYNNVCQNHTNPNGCIHAWGKSIWRPDRCGAVFVHWCAKYNGTSYNPDVKTELRINHYAFRSREHVEGLNDLLKPTKKAAYDHFDDVWFSSRWDPLPHNVTGLLEKNNTELLQKNTSSNSWTAASDLWKRLYRICVSQPSDADPLP